MLYLRSEYVKLTGNPVFVFCEMLDVFDCSRIDVFQISSRLMNVQNMVVKPFAFEKHLVQFFSLCFVQSLLDYLALEDFADLILTTSCCSKASCFDRSFLFVWTCQSVVFFAFHLILFTLETIATLLEFVFYLNLFVILFTLETIAAKEGDLCEFIFVNNLFRSCCQRNTAKSRQLP